MLVLSTLGRNLIAVPVLTSFAFAASLMAMAISSGIGRAGPVGDLADADVLRELVGGVSGDCTSAQTSSLIACVDCQTNGNGGWVKCDTSATATTCTVYHNPSQCISCTNGTMNCPGNIITFQNQQDCMADMNGVMGVACQRTYDQATDSMCFNHLNCP